MTFCPIPVKYVIHSCDAQKSCLKTEIEETLVFLNRHYFCHWNNNC